MRSRVRSVRRSPECGQNLSPEEVFFKKLVTLSLSVFAEPVQRILPVGVWPFASVLADYSFIGAIERGQGSNLEVRLRGGDRQVISLLTATDH